MFVTAQNILKTPVERNFEREQNAIEHYKKRIAKEVPAFNPEYFDPEEYNKVLTWLARYGLHVADSIEQREKIYPKPEKGLLINGRTGRGKSTVAALVSMMFNNYYDYRIPFFSLGEIDKAWAASPSQCEYDYSDAFNASTSVIIDDVGAEGMMKHFGNEPVFNFLMQQLYNNWKYYGKSVIMTSNLSTYDAPEAAKDPRTFLGIYGERINSRIHEMFEIVRINGEEDLRKVAQEEGVLLNG